MNDLEVKSGNISFEIHQKVIEAKQDIERSFIKLGGLLKEIRDQRIYESLGYDTFESYIAQPELAFDRSTVYAIIGVYEDFVLSVQSDIDKLAKIGYAKLNRVRQFKNQDNFEEWIKKAEVLSLSDLSAEIREAKGITEGGSKIPEPKTVNVTCPYCGRKFDFILKE